MASLSVAEDNDGQDSLNTVPSSLSANELRVDRRLMPDPALLAGVELSDTGDPGQADDLKLLPLFGAVVYSLEPGTCFPTMVLSLPSVSLPLSGFPPKVVAS